jgi:prepilin peptidase CpaA
VPVVAVILAAITDVRSFKVYNALSLPLLASGVIYHGLAGGMGAVGASLLGAFFGFCILLPMYLAGGMGAGDVKLLAAIGAWIGLPHTLLVFIAASLVAGAYAFFLILWYRKGGETLTNLKIIWYRIMALGRHLARDERVEAAVNLPDRRGRLIPFGAMIAVGLIATLLWPLLAKWW